MRIWIMSDLHLNDRPLEISTPSPIPDVLVVAGDVMAPFAGGLRWLRQQCSIPIVCVAGNSDFHGVDMTIERRIAAQIARELGITFLDEDCAIIGSVRFVGVTLWTDYSLDGNPALAMSHAEGACSDHRNIRIGDERLGPRQALACHRRSRSWLEGVLAEPFQGPTVVVTHHAPSGRSIGRQYAGHPLNPSFASNLEGLMLRHHPDLWVHGHVHSCCDYRVGRTRVVSNARGTPSEETGFQPGLVLEVSECRVPSTP
ncbi:calcineurin-like phosphoesterase family protein [Azorhizobium sp. AG788]|uniref:metallophosphoesterase n=1 Tax=Azorhizobium sp. AG788 TaxID=2183897 RepID=UPI0010609277|nr:metallophosphoesterase [Azorhizobium sp. AG788]TDT92485.1 calcineurin-like phosphoesterase family protein [Azorhizobium sp. AG788]